MENEKTAIIVAIVALLATILGAIIGAVTNYVIVVKRERLDRETDKRKNAIAVKRAARLIHAELALGAESLDYGY